MTKFQNQVLILIIGVVLVLFGYYWKKPSPGISTVHKYGSIVMGVVLIIAIILKWLGLFGPM